MFVPIEEQNSGEWGCVCSPACWRWPAAVYFQVNSDGRQLTHTPQPGRWAYEDRTSSAETEAGKRAEKRENCGSHRVALFFRFTDRYNELRDKPTARQPSVPWNVHQWCCRTGHLSSSSQWHNQGRAPWLQGHAADLETENKGENEIKRADIHTNIPQDVKHVNS